jgi:hypothetical protein
MDQRRTGITAGPRRFSAAILIVSALASWLAVAGGIIVARADSPYNEIAPYNNPLRDVTNLAPARIDQGVDYYGTGTMYAIGDGVVDYVCTGGCGWPGGTFIRYRLTKGLATGYEVYAAECISPSVVVGDATSSNLRIGFMTNCGYGIETGWADPNYPGRSLGYSQWNGNDPTWYGNNFNQFVTTFGAPGGIPYGPVRGSGASGWPTTSGGAQCSAKSGSQYLKLASTNQTVVIPYAGHEQLTIDLERIVAPDLTWCFQTHATMSWVEGYQPSPTGKFDLNVRVSCNHSLEGVGWAFDYSYTNSDRYVNTGWWHDNGDCNIAWGADDADGSYGSQVVDQFGNKFNYGLPTWHATYVTYGTF